MKSILKICLFWVLVFLLMEFTFGEVKESFVWDAKTKSKKIEKRVNDKDVVILKVENFNYLKYSIDVSIDEKESESYRYLDKLWQELLGIKIPFVTLFGNADTRVAFAGFEENLINWVKEMRKIEDSMDKVLDDKILKNVIVNKQDYEGIYKNFDLDKKSIIEKRGKLYDDIENIVQLQLFDQYDKFFVNIIKKISEFESRSDKIINGDEICIAKKKVGTFITLKLTPVEILTGIKNEKETRIVEYFVQSSLPVDFHVGMTWKSFKSIQFEKVRSFASQDLYLKVKENTSFEGVAFLSYCVTCSKKPIFWISLGTEVSAPGKNLYLGISEKFAKKLFVTAGCSLAEKTDPVEESKVIDKIADELNVRTLYTQIKTRHKPAFFIGISYGII